MEDKEATSPGWEGGEGRKQEPPEDTGILGFKGGERSDTQSAQLVWLAEDRRVDLFNYGDRAYASFPSSGHTETALLKGLGFRGWLLHEYFKEQNRVPGNQALQDALNQLEARARFEGPTQPVGLRVAAHDGALWLDLANKDWEVVKITAAGWEIVRDPPVRFRRTKGMLALPHPVAGGSIEELRPHLNIAGEADFILIVGWLTGALRSSGPYAVLGFNVEQGSAKSFMTGLLRSVIDPNLAPHRSLPGSTQDLIIAASNAWLLAFDNLSFIPKPMSDALCRLATGAGFSTRQLYTDSEEVIVFASNSILLNGIGEIATAPDLLDRSVLVSLPPIPSDRRRPEHQLLAEFEVVRPRVLGALLTAVSSGLKNLPHTQVPELPRMADFALWVTACEEGLSWAPGTFLETYRQSLKEARVIALEANPIGHLVLGIVEEYGEWSGTATELLRWLLKTAPEESRRRRDWPQTSHHLSNALKRIAPTLREEGVEVEMGKTRQSRYIRLTRVERAE